MHRTQKKVRNLPLVILTVVCTGLLLYTHSAFGMENDIKPYQPSAFMLIQNKTVHEIVASKKRFEVTRETEILDVNGSLIKLQMLPVPCKAQVDYELRVYGDPIVLRIKLIEVFAVATLNWTRPSPE